MNFLALLAALLCAGLHLHLALAAPFTELRRQRAAAEHVRRSSPLNLTDPGNGTHPGTSKNWAGAMLSGQGFVSVTADITVPVPKPGYNTAGKDSSSSAWVGIDGVSCSNAILQTGIDMSVSKLDFVTYDAWFEWFPDYTHAFDDLVIVAGDQLTLTVTVNGTSGGSATIHNRSSRHSSTVVFHDWPDLCETSAEWIVEDFKLGDGTTVPFANFGTVAFTNAVAQAGAQAVGVQDATVIDIKQDGKMYTSCSLPDDSSVSCQYIA